MFEFDEDIVEVLLKEDMNFRRLYDKYLKLKQDIISANEGSMSVEGVMLEKMKKEKLSLKDQMTKMIKDYRDDNTATIINTE